ncbi:hypothetical protein [Flectobacillus major]|uniref:hypothetical protein n=1 Tax=Flectobacillus major TaxID=103 RepID=UPI000429603F|nr:hypothetical protein [Flectobacillus major]
MKNKILPLVFMLIGMATHLSQAQYEQGTKFWQVDGRFSGSISSSSVSTGMSGMLDQKFGAHSVGLSFKRGVFTGQNTAKGWLLGYNVQSFHSTSGNSAGLDWYNHTIEAGYFVDKFKPLSKSVAIYAEMLGKAGYGFQSGDYLESTKTYNVGASVNFGVRYQLKNKWFLNAETSLVNLNFQHVNDNTSNYSNLKFNSIMNVSTLGIAIGKSF